MTIDFSPLDRLTNAAGQPEKKQGTLHPSEAKNAPQGKITALDAKRHYIKLEAEANRAETTATMFQEYQENIKRSELLRAEITKGIQAGAEPFDLLLKAIEAIARMTGDKLFFEENRKALVSVYGALGYSAPITHDAHDTQERLNRLCAALEQEPEEAARRRIEAAIKAHREKLKRLDHLQANADK